MGISARRFTPVCDGLGDDRHSVFTGILLQVLRERADTVREDHAFTFRQLAAQVESRVANAGVNQIPDWGALGVGDGDFVFRPTVPVQTPREQLDDLKGRLRAENTRNVLFFENFEGNVDRWRETGDCDSCIFKDGVLRVDRFPSEIRIPNSVLYKDFSYEVKVASQTARTDWRVALRFGSSPEDDFYFFIVSRRYGALLSFYKLTKKTKADGLVDLIPATEIHGSKFKPSSELNCMRVVAEGPQLSLYFNDELLDTFVDSKTLTGRLSFVALTGEHLVFDDIKVTKSGK